LKAFEARLASALPESYTRFLLFSNGAEGPVGSAGYIQLWAIQDIEVRRAGYQFDSFLPQFLPIGSDGGGEALVIAMHRVPMSFGYMPIIGMAEDDYVEIGTDFGDVLAAIGAGKVFG
jgi:hypothetical protein